MERADLNILFNEDVANEYIELGEWEIYKLENNNYLKKDLQQNDCDEIMSESQLRDWLFDDSYEDFKRIWY